MMSNNYEIFEKRNLEKEVAGLLTTIGEKAFLLRAHDKEQGVHEVRVVMPWGTGYKLCDHGRIVDAQVHFERAYNEITVGDYLIHLTGPATAELLPPKE